MKTQSNCGKEEENPNRDFILKMGEDCGFSLLDEFDREDKNFIFYSEDVITSNYREDIFIAIPNSNN